MQQFEDRIILQDIGQAQQIGGLADENIRLIEKRTGACIVARGQEILLGGSKGRVAAAKLVLDYLIKLSYKKELTHSDLQYALTLGSDDSHEKIADCLGEVIHSTNRGKQIRAKTIGQYRYVKAIDQKDITFGIGPAGTGKTYLAVVMALKEIGRASCRERVSA